MNSGISQLDDDSDSSEIEFERYDTAAHKGNTTIPRIQFRHRSKAKTKTPSEKAEQHAQNQENRSKIEQLIKRAHAAIHDIAVELTEGFGHTTEYWTQQILHRDAIPKSSRSISLWNAYQSIEAEKANAVVPEGQPRDNINKLSAKFKASYAAALEDDKMREALIARAKELEERRQTKAWASHNVAASCWNDYRATMSIIVKQANQLFQRTGVEILVMAVRPNQNYYNKPYVWHSSPRIGTFYEIIANKAITDVATQLEAYCISGVEGVKKNHKERLSSLKQECVKMIVEKLRVAATPYNIPGMQYAEFDARITAPYGIVYEGWPLPTFRSPHQMTSLTELQVLNAALENNTFTFRKMSGPEHTQWLKTHAEKTVANSSLTTSLTNALDDNAGPSSTSLTSRLDIDDSSSSSTRDQVQAPTLPTPSLAPPAAVEAESIQTIDTTHSGQKRLRPGELVFRLSGPKQKKPRKERSDKGKRRDGQPAPPKKKRGRPPKAAPLTSAQEGTTL